MKIIVIGSAQSGLGKTTLIEWLLKKISNIAVIKFTVCDTNHKRRCPRGRPCGVCAALKGDFIIQEGKEIPEIEGKDTFRYKQAGAKKVIWVRTRPHAAEKAIHLALDRLDGFRKVVIEGNHALYFVKPRVSVMIMGKKHELKPSAKENLPKVNIFFVPPAIKFQDIAIPMSQLDNRKVFFMDIRAGIEERDRFIDFVRKQLKN